MRLYIHPLFFLIFCVFALEACKKDKFLTQGGQLNFSTDTLHFDTIFTTMGSVTRWVKVYNPYNQKIKINQIKLAKENASPFRLNVDGLPGKVFNDIEIAANDSLYIFAAVTIDPNNDNSPFVVEDKILCSLNGETNEIPLEAYGQNAHYIYDSVLKSQTWTNDKPYVIIHSCLLDSAQVLTIQKGCRIYMHADSKFLVDGTLRVFGTKTDSVVFQGDRIDRDHFGYEDTPGEWCGIFFLSNSFQNNINYTIIKNAGNTPFFVNDQQENVPFYPCAVYASPHVPLGGPITEFNNCTIANSGGYGVLAFNTNLRFNNCLIHSCGLQNILTSEGGDYEFNYCTIANYGGVGLNHTQEPTVAFLNYRDIDDVNYTGADLKIRCNNTIIYGSLNDELVVNKKGTWLYDVVFSQCIIKRQTAIPSGLVLINNVQLNKDPLFNEVGKWDYHVASNSPAKLQALPLALYPLDLDGKNRSTATPTIGCYE